MKKLLILAAFAACASGCVMTGGKSTVASSIEMDVMYPDTSFIDNSVKPEKVGTATASGIICFVKGDSSLKAAMDNGGIKKVHHVDYKSFNVFGIVGEQTTIVYGE